MKFTADATARKESRMDYSGGAENQTFFLQNCGFFNETTTIDSFFERKPTGIPPVNQFYGFTIKKTVQLNILIELFSFNTFLFVIRYFLFLIFLNSST
jgi:hypothetical protein